MIPRRFRFFALAALGAIVAMTPSLAQQADGSTHQVSVVGHGTVKVLPDTVHITFGVKANDPVVAKAKATVDRAISGILKACDDLGVDRSGVTATDLNVGEDYDFESSRRTFKGYEVTRSVEVTLTKLEAFNGLVQRAVEAGANDVGGVTLGSSKDHELQLQALTAALRDAKEQAAHVAHEVGKQLGDVKTVNTEEANRRTLYSGLLESVTVSAERRVVPMEFRPGPIEVSTQVYVTFELK